jgi:FkbM family methyltransferase
MEIRSFYLRHRIISAIKDSKFKGSLLLSKLLEDILIPKPKKEIIIQTLHGFILNINPAIDNGVEKSIYRSGTYEKGTLYIMENFLRPNDIFVDVGANIGLMSILASNLVGPNGRVLAFEPNPEIKSILDYNVNTNKLYNIRTFEVALGSKQENGKIYLKPDVNRGAASLIKPDNNSISYDIKVIRYDNQDYSFEKSISLVKVDVEGYEIEALTGFGSLLTSENAPALIVECSGKTMDSLTLFNFLKQLNDYTFYKLSRGKERIAKLKQITHSDNLPQHDNIFCFLESHKHRLNSSLFT